MMTFGLKQKVYAFGLGKIGGIVRHVWQELVRFSVSVFRKIDMRVER